MHDKLFGNRLKQLRKISGLTQEDVARLLDIKIRTYQNHEAGQWPNRRTQEKYITFYGCHKGWFLTGDGVPYKDDISKNDFKFNRNKLQDGEGLWGKTHHREVEGTRLTITEFEPKDGQAQDPFLAAITDLREIFDSRDQVLIPAIQANIRAFQLSARREHQNARQARQIKALQDECDELKKRFDTLEKTYTETSTPGPEGGNINRKVI